ncbi:uncharacterized protein LOC112249387 isoform X2 [Oncorhynchus tshawytscha]|uniref:uncharacterized protein LOC112249387 isoform X2 n=1 Tax=Oncorhynchus tshawytscha TaxID=74940 RepID=UPI001C3C24A7|nr:uncharacterized protein LOC112249387 isoform X2 [Oncorhynchus tshawytscha]
MAGLQCVKMDTIYNLLQQHRLDTYHHKFLTLGVQDERDFTDSVNGEDLDKMGFSQVEKNRFEKMKDFIQRHRAPQQAMPVQKPMESFQLWYTYPHCPELKEIRDMDPATNTVEDLMLRICHQEGIENSKTVCLYTVDGMPLTDDPFFNTWSLKDRHIEIGSELYAMFTPKENLRPALLVTLQEMTDMTGEDNVRCHIMLKGDFEVKVDLASDTLRDLRQKLSDESGIPAHVLHYRCGVGQTLLDCGINEESTVVFSLSSFPDERPDTMEFYFNDVVPSVQQSQKGLSAFFSSLYAINNREHRSGDVLSKVIAYIRKLSGCNPLAQSLHQLLYRNEVGTRTQKVAIVEGLYNLFRELLPSFHKRRGDKIIEDSDVFENAPVCWAYLLSEAKKESSQHEVYVPIVLNSQPGERFCDPVRVPGLPDVFEREYVLQKIKDGEKIPNCSVEILTDTSMSRASDVEKILLSLPPFIKTFPKWASSGLVTGQNFQIVLDDTFAKMNEEVKEYVNLTVTPALQLKDVGVYGPRLVFLEENNLGVYICKQKGSPQDIYVFDCLAMKFKTLNVDELANVMRDIRSDLTFMTTRTPKEAILVLVDSSSSMNETCYDSDDNMTRLDAVKQLFDNFATRSMAYNFHHVIGLVKFDSSVKTLHTFTETLETFKEHVHSLEANGCTVLYDALKRGMSQLKQVGEQFPDCRLRIICLTDGKDDGSMTEPDAVTTKLMSLNIVVDAIVVGKVDNNVLHGISNATGGCCFKPETSKAGLKLFEMETVLSLEMRKLKKKLDPSYIRSESILVALFANRGYDEKPEVALPSGLNDKVTGTENALKKKIQESKSGRFLEKDKRLLEELKSLHCDPHPFCTVLPSESDFTFWKILMQGPPDTPYEDGVFELYCQFGADYPVKPPLVRFVTPVYHCNINSVGRICHNIFDRSYNAHITMREILDAVYGLLIVPEPQDPLDSILAEEYLTSRNKYEEEAKKNTEEVAGQSLDDMEKELLGEELPEKFIPSHLICPLTNKMFVDPVKNQEGTVYERKAIEKHLKRTWLGTDPKTNKLLTLTDLKPYQDMRKMARDYRKQQIQ